MDAGALHGNIDKDKIKPKGKGGALLSVLKKIRTRASAQKRISLPSPGLRSACGVRMLRGSMTVEACFVLPFFLFAFLNMISILELYRLQGDMSTAMHDAAKQMAVQGYGYQKIRGAPAGTAESLGLTWACAAAKVKGTIGQDRLDRSLIVGGSHGIDWSGSVVMQADECIDLVAQYRIAPPAVVVGYDDILFYNRLRTRAWTGYDNADGAGRDSTGEEIVYITPDGTVYHRERGCTYLKLSITAVDIGFLKEQRNESGEIYHPCSECGRSCGNTVYITDHGNRYHASLGCSSLKRTIMAVPISQAAGWGACSKCG